MNYRLLLAVLLLSLGLLSGCDTAEQNAAGESEAAKPGVVQPSPAVSAEQGDVANTAEDVEEMDNQALPDDIVDPDETAGGLYEDQGIVEEENPVDEAVPEEGTQQESGMEQSIVQGSDVVADEEEAPVENDAAALPPTEGDTPNKP